MKKDLKQTAHEVATLCKTKDKSNLYQAALIIAFVGVPKTSMHTKATKAAYDVLLKDPYALKEAFGAAKQQHYICRAQRRIAMWSKAWIKPDRVYY